MPLPTGHGKLKPLVGDYWEYDLYLGRKRFISDDQPPRSVQQYYRQTLWPNADIDLFIYGLDEKAAQDKLIAILTHLQRTIIRTHGIQHDVFFVKTQNTVTVTCSAVTRPIQVILRLYESKEAVLNGFDIDCCCVGYDGTNTLITPRAITAIRRRVNRIDLNLRGECYESRLLKYVERGFAIEIPLLDNSKRDRAHLAFKIEKSPYFDGQELNGEGWSKWGDSENLERLLMAESLARLQNGVIDRPFPGRERMSSGRERPLQIKIVSYPMGAGPVKDFYGTKDKAGNPIWPATTKLEAIKKNEDKFEVKWLEGNMPRKPLTWEEWSVKAYMGGTRRESYNSEEWKRKAEERKARENESKERELETVRKEARAQVEAEKDQAIAEREAIRLEAAEREAELKRAKKDEETKARQAAAEKRVVEAKLAKAREDKQRLELRAEEELSRAEGALARANERAEALEEAADDKLCCICLDEHKSVMFEPCRHVSMCGACASQVDQCPLCKVVPTRKVSVYL